MELFIHVQLLTHSYLQICSLDCYSSSSLCAFVSLLCPVAFCVCLYQAPPRYFQAFFHIADLFEFSCSPVQSDAISYLLCLTNQAGNKRVGPGRTSVDSHLVPSVLLMLNPRGCPLSSCPASSICVISSSILPSAAKGECCVRQDQSCCSDEDVMHSLLLSCTRMCCICSVLFLSAFLANP